MNAPLDANRLARLHSQWTAQWHEAATLPEVEAPWSFIERNHRMNFDLWHEEDVARRDDLGAEAVRKAKRTIDKYNQARNDAIERLDEWLLSQVPLAAPGSQQHSETPGMIIDRLSILSLKLYHMRIEAERDTASRDHRALCRDKAGILEEQANDLRRCLAELLSDLMAGKRHFKLYRQLKMYNDASLNPQLYAKK